DPRAAQRDAYPRSPTNSLPSPAIPHPLHTYHGGLRGQIPPYRCDHGAHGGVYKASFGGAETFKTIPLRFKTPEPRDHRNHLYYLIQPSIRDYPS
ncbi:hypothetical protein C8J57DRAFT_1723122, partial [Mycena rebaudengoi]